LNIYLKKEANKEELILAVFKEIEISKLNEAPTRDIRDHIVDDIAELINEDGYNDGFPLTVLDKDEKLIVADGNHRLKALNKLEYEGKVPILMHSEGNLYELAVKANKAAGTLAKSDLFDWLEVIKSLSREDYNQAEIGSKIGWSRTMVSDYMAVNKIDDEVLALAKKHQKERTSNNDEDSSFNFTQYWFRTSGIYDLDEENQLEFMEWFTKTKKCKAGKRQVQKKTESLKEIQEQIELLVSEMPEIEEKEREENKLKEAIKNGEYTTGRLKEVIEKYKNKAKNKALFGVDALEEIKKLETNSVDCVIFDPPWGIGFKNFRDNEKPDYGLEMNEVEDLLTTAVTEIKRVSKANAHIYTFFSMEVFEKFYNLLDKNFLTNKTPLIWAKNNHNPCDYKNKYAQIYEPILFCKNENEKRKLNNSVSPNVLNFDKVNGQDKYHDSQKPIELMEYLIKNSTSVKETVLDPFMGSGVSLLAAAKNDRHFIGFEKETVYEGNFKRILSEM
jgi:DNA modification methylase